MADRHPVPSERRWDSRAWVDNHRLEHIDRIPFGYISPVSRNRCDKVVDRAVPSREACQRQVESDAICRTR